MVLFMNSDFFHYSQKVLPYFRCELPEVKAEGIGFRCTPDNTKHDGIP